MRIGSLILAISALFGMGASAADVEITPECAWPGKVTDFSARTLCQMWWNRTPEERAALLKERAMAPVEPSTWADFEKSNDPADKRLAKEIKDGLVRGQICLKYGREIRRNKYDRRRRAFEAFANDVFGSDPGMRLVPWNNEIFARDIKVGMGMCAAFAALGDITGKNVTETAAGKSYQWVFGHMYVYTGDDLVITTIQR